MTLFSSLSAWTVPSCCRWDAENPPKFTIWHNILFAFAGGFFSANQYYSHPILELLAQDFHTTQSGAANIPTLTLAGEVTGLLLILPLADFFPRRRFALLLLSLTILFWVPLCVTSNFSIFQLFSYLACVTTGVIQIFIVLVSELSPPKERAFNISIVAAGPTFGILLARILSGIVANYTSWRNVYFLSLGLQIVMLILLWCFMPDYPATNNISVSELTRRYPWMLYDIVALLFKHPVLMQAGILSFCTFFTVSSYWTTLTFLLSEAPYHYSTIVIGLFGLIGASTMVLGPVYGKYIIRPLDSPLLSAAIGKVVSLTGIVIGTFVGTRHVAGPVIQALLLDAGLMILQVSNRMSIHDCEPKAMNRVNTSFISCLYLGMLAGAKAGNQVYENYGGWLASGGLSIGVIGFSFVIILARGPHESRWIGWSGGWSRGAKNAQDVENPEAIDGGRAEKTPIDVKVESKRTSSEQPTQSATAAP